jgi:hypothetical protein
MRKMVNDSRPLPARGIWEWLKERLGGLGSDG